MSAVNSPEAVFLYGVVPAVTAVTLVFGWLGLRRAVGAVLDRAEAWLDDRIARHVDLALTGPWNDGLDQATVDRIWAAMQNDLRDAS